MPGHIARAAPHVVLGCVLLVAAQSVWADDMPGGAATELIAAINNKDKNFTIRGTIYERFNGVCIATHDTTRQRIRAVCWSPRQRAVGHSQRQSHLCY